MAHVLEKKQNSLTDSVEFKDAVQFAVQEALAKSLAEMKAAQAQSEASLLAKAFAMEMARMVGPLNGQIYVDPEVLESREIARKKMAALIEEVKKGGEKPRYRIINKCFFGTKVLEPGVVSKGYNGSNSEHKYKRKEISWEEVPNNALFPVNKIARDIYDEWKKSISMEMDPVGIEETWITENGITMYGRNPETIDNRIKPKAHPGLTEDDDDDGIDSAVFRKKLDDFSSLDSFQGIVDTNRNKMNIESSLY
jgi:hypothetical protein